MASKAIFFFLFLNLILFTTVTATYVPTPCPPPPKLKKVSPKLPPAQPKCPRDTLKFGVCADLLDGLVHVVVGTPLNTPCCSLINGLVDLEAAVCLCTAIKANVLGINIDASVSLSLILNNCGKKVPSGFKCA